ncbi:MAG: DUF6266 family protein [Flavobacteriaceae bacterium]|jgi:hypothetical protein|nr:DUF6266 family protein [Flavobacteriaceae bacterium]
MAYIDKHGLIHGKCGNKVFSVRNKKQIVSNLPQKRSTPPTKAQLLQQQKFAIASKVSHAFRSLFEAFQSTYHANKIQQFTSYLLKNHVEVHNDQPFLNYNHLVLLYGALPCYSSFSIQKHFEGMITVEWDSLSYPKNITPLPAVALIAYCPTLNVYIDQLQVERQGEGFAVFCLDKAWKGKEVHCWAYGYYLKNTYDYPLKQQQFSTTTYLGSLVL